MSAISRSLQDAFCAQMIQEHLSASIYHNIAAAFAKVGLQGFRAYFMKQADEEREHAEKLAGFVMDRQGNAYLGAIPASPAPTSYLKPLDAFASAYEHEQKVTAMIQALYDAAVKDRDYGAQEFLDWFAHEQVQEELQAFTWMSKVGLAGENAAAILALDGEAAA